MKMRSVLLWLAFGAVLLAPGVAQARPEFFALFVQHYRLEPYAPNAVAACRNCHTTPPRWNLFGLEVKAELYRVGGRRLTAAMLEAVEGGDADQDGWLNGDEIRAGSLPGDAESHPEGHPGDPAKPLLGTTGPIGAAPPKAPPPAPVSEPAVPPHSFHPAIVHFPVALFLFGALLDVVGFRRDWKGTRDTARLNLLAGAIATSLAVPTGLAALLRLGFPLDRVAVHLIFALGAVALLAGVALWRRRQPPVSAAYWALLAAASIAVTLAGHFGSALVFG